MPRKTKKQLEEEFLKSMQIKQWKEEGSLCPKCQQTKLETIDNGLVEIIYDYIRNGCLGTGMNVAGTGKQEYQFHYKKCPECDYWEMIEYRETPTWWDDLWNLNCPFTKGDVIEDFKNGKVYKHQNDKFVKYRITR
ncbi:MAG: hypothetical protein J6W16_05940 [Methanobrevibacter sp.]|nr:hypothetical protein [Methanobrevibacter sp.]